MSVVGARHSEAVQCRTSSLLEDYNFLEPLLNPGGYIIVTGTRYIFDDPYEQIQKKAELEMAELGKSIWKFSIKNCWKNGDKSQGPFFPATKTVKGKPIGQSMEFLEGMRRQLGDEMFSCQYENSPIISGDTSFTDELIASRTLYHLTQLPNPLMPRVSSWVSEQV